jgi:hypothetical protein
MANTLQSLNTDFVNGVVFHDATHCKVTTKGYNSKNVRFGYCYNSLICKMLISMPR